MSFWDVLGDVGFGMFSRINEGQRQNDAIDSNKAINRQATNQQLELLDKSYPLITGAYKEKRIADNQANRLASWTRIAETPSQYKYWN
jgi:hypothetical protein